MTPARRAEEFNFASVWPSLEWAGQSSIGLPIVNGALSMLETVHVGRKKMNVLTLDGVARGSRSTSIRLQTDAGSPDLRFA